MDNYLYLIINLTAISLPFACSFEHRVRYFKKFLSLAPGFLSTIVFFIVWDIFFTKWGIWGFNKNYLMGLEFFALPLEEYLFFLCIPYSSLFIHFCKEKLTPKLKFSNLTTKFFVIGLTSFLLIISILNLKIGRKITIKLELKIINERGLHARASAKFAAVVDSYKSFVEVTKDNLVVPGNSIMGLLTLAAEKGSVISIKITDEDEKVLEEKLKSLVNNYFGEGI